MIRGAMLRNAIFGAWIGPSIRAVSVRSWAHWLAVPVACQALRQAWLVADATLQGKVCVMIRPPVVPTQAMSRSRLIQRRTRIWWIIETCRSCPWPRSPHDAEPARRRGRGELARSGPPPAATSGSVTRPGD